jgi:hypothetical protein
VPLPTCAVPGPPSSSTRIQAPREERCARVTRSHRRSFGPDPCTIAVLDERLHRERGDLERAQLVGHVELEAQAIAKPHALDLEIVGDHAQLLAERDQPGLRVEREPEQRAQPLEQILGAPRILRDQRDRAVERVEQEVRLRLRRQRGEPSFERCGRSACAFTRCAPLRCRPLMKLAIAR